MSKRTMYWLWVDDKAGVLRHDLPQALKDDDEVSGRCSPTWEGALTHLRRMMKKGYSVRVYQSEAAE